MGPAAFGFLRFGPLDVVDILLVSFLAYQLLKLFRGTRAPYIFLGLVLFIAVAVVADLLNFAAFNQIMVALRTIGLIAFVIVFQPEIRRALAQVGQNPLFRAFFREPEIDLDELVAASFMLRDRELGAIIVLERTMGLREFLEEQGTLIQSKVSASLLVSIFTPPSPLHDGAVIIKGREVLAAGVLLPLTTESQIETWFGTRHRAALGITESSDAVAVVVSEERSTVRVAVGGSISGPLDRDGLTARLSEEFGMTSGERGKRG